MGDVGRAFGFLSLQKSTDGTDRGAPIRLQSF